ncbi:hypothetical protein [Clostridium sp. HBUAS56010]|uniref:hypothetical protein n=1 Tax=Clostridium sp. HBUAS56010 TaxID=2571127 RepID=UPI00117790BD|nr:hypothetical protein [Clostridium sp. HBUAS56010]
METLLGLLFIIGMIVYYKAKTARPRYGTQEYLDWKYKDYPGGGEYMKSVEKRAMDCSYGHLDLTPSEKAAIKKHEGK